MSEQQLPLPDFDELPLGTLGHRVRALTENDVRLLLDHERAHANRVQVVQLLTHRIDELEQGATPSSGAESEPVDVPGHTSSGSPVTPSGPRESDRPTVHGTRSNTGKGIEHS